MRTMPSYPKEFYMMHLVKTEYIMKLFANQSRLFRAITGLFVLTQVWLANPLSTLAVTHDDQESLIPEFYISFRGNGAGTPTLTAQFNAYQMPNGSGGFSNYIESISTNGFSDGITWSNVSLYVNHGMPLDQNGTLQITGQNIAEYKVFVNSPDPKYQPYVGIKEQHLIYWTNTLGGACSTTTNILFKHLGDKGANVGKAASIMPGWRNFKLGLGYGKTGNSLGYVTFLYGNTLALPDTSQEIAILYHTNNSIIYSQTIAPQMVYEAYWDANYAESGYATGAYRINGYDMASQSGHLVTSGGSSYYDFSGFTPVVSYVLNYAAPTITSTSGGYTLAGYNSYTTTKVKRSEGALTMDSTASTESFGDSATYYTYCFPAVCFPPLCFPDGWCVDSCAPGFCNTVLVAPPKSTFTSTIYDWATAGLAGSRNCRSSTMFAVYNQNVPASETTSNTVSIGTRTDSWYTESSSASYALPSKDYFWPGLSIVHDGSGGQFTGSAQYYWKPGSGSHLKLQYETQPGGGWTGYEYYDDLAERGMLLRVTQPYGNLPASPATNAVGAMVTTFTYTNDWDKSKTLPLEVVSKIKGATAANDLVISRKTFDYSGSYANGTDVLYQATLPIWVTEEHDYFGPGLNDYTTTITKKFRPDGPRMFANLPVSIQHPDGTKDVWNYEVGTYDPVARAFSYIPGNPNPLITLYSYATYRTSASRIWKISCFPSTAPGAEPLTIDNSSYIVANRSTAEVQTRDQYGRLAMVQTMVYVGSGIWQPLEAETHSYDAAGNLTASYKLMDAERVWVPVYEAEYTDINGASTSYTAIVFSNSGNPTGRKQYERDRSGTITKYGYDDYGRVTSTMVLQAPASFSPGVNTYYTYDSDNRILKTLVGTSATDASALVSSNAYNLAGMKTMESTPGGFTTTYDYSQVGSRIVTKNILGLNNAAYYRTEVTTKNRDGTVQSVSGTAVIPQCHFYTNVVSGTVTLLDGTVSSAGTPRAVSCRGTAGPAMNSRTNVVDVDWLGHTVRTESANPASVGNLVTTYAYNNQGQLTQTIVGNLAPVINQYDLFGELYRSGIKLADSSGFTSLNPAAMDRISEQTTYFTNWNNAWWEATINSTYPNNNDATPFVTQQTYQQRSGFKRQSFLPSSTVYDGGYSSYIYDANLLMPDAYTIAIDAHGNATQSGKFIDRYNAYAVTEQDSDLTGGYGFMTGNNPSANGWSSRVVAVNGQTAFEESGNAKAASSGLYHVYDNYGRQVFAVNVMAVDAQGAAYQQPYSGYIYYNNTTEVAEITNFWDGSFSYYIYNPMGLVATNIQFTSSLAGEASMYSYNLRGQVTATWGDIPYPATNIYYTSAIGTDYHSELEGELYDQWAFHSGSWASWPSSLPTPSINRYYYYPQSGLLSSNVNLGSGKSVSVGYTYNQRGDMATRTWNRGVVTAYAYNETAGANSGELARVSYSDDPSGTNQLSYTYNRLGALSGVTDACGTRSYAYRTSDQQLDHEILPTPIYPPGNWQVGLNYDGKGRLSGYWHGVFQNGAPVSVSYGYYDSGPSDFSGRLSTINTPIGSFGYSYYGGTPHVATVAGPSTPGGSLAQTNLYAVANGLQLFSGNTLGAGTLAAYSLYYDGFHRLAASGDTGRLYSVYGSGLSRVMLYNGRNEVTNCTTYLTNLPIYYPSAKALPRRNFAFNYDCNGNRTNTVVDSDAPLNYTVNFLEQYTNRTNPRFVEVSGASCSNTYITAFRSNVVFSLTNVSVGVGSNFYFFGRSPRATTNAGGETLMLSNVLLSAGTVIASDVVLHGVLAPPTNQVFGYDQDGNLTNDVLWAYSYDEENRIKQIQTLPALLNDTNVPPVQLTFTYDFLGRRAQKQVWSYSGGSWVLASTTVFVYSGNNLIAEWQKSGSSFQLTKSYYWGLDKSASLQGAGGIGGLLGMATHTGNKNTYAAINDPWGNVVGMVDMNVGIPVAEYEYTPFGESLRAMGTLATNNPWRYSTKYFDRETGLLNFGCRYYSPNLGRFVNRDPKDELGRLMLSAPLMGGNVAAWSYIGDLVGVPGKNPALTPNTPAGLSHSNEKQDGGYRDSSEPGNIFAHRKGSTAQGGHNAGGSSRSPNSVRMYNHSYRFVNNSPYMGIDACGLQMDYLTEHSNLYQRQQALGAQDYTGGSFQIPNYAGLDTLNSVNAACQQGQFWTKFNNYVTGNGEFYQTPEEFASTWASMVLFGATVVSGLGELDIAALSMGSVGRSSTDIALSMPREWYLPREIMSNGGIAGAGPGAALRNGPDFLMNVFSTGDVIGTTGAAKTVGSGPASGFLEVSDAYASSKAVQNFASPTATDFIFDSQSGRFIMGDGGILGHDGILAAGKITPSETTVGGTIWRENGSLMTDEWSGHYGQNWTPEIRQQFQNFMQQNGVNITHTPWGQ